MTQLYAIQREILEYVDEQSGADATAIRRRLAYTADVTVTYDALEPHLERLEARGHIESRGADESGTTYYRTSESAVRPGTASD